MGVINSVKCKNKDCGYQASLREGPGMLGFAYMMTFRKQILSGEISNPTIAEKFKNGAKIMTRGIFLCPACKEFKNDNTYYLLENITYSPYGKKQYDVTFPFGKPSCDVCNSELMYIKNVRSPKIKCPKCNGTLIAQIAGYTD